MCIRDRYRGTWHRALCVNVCLGALVSLCLLLLPQSVYGAIQTRPIWFAGHQTHTTMSADNPNGASPEERDAGLMKLFDAAGTCDHDTDVDWDEWAATIQAVNKHNQDNKFTYIFGMEWSGYQHMFYITLNPSPTPKNPYSSDFNEVKKVAAWLAANQGVGWYAHPVSVRTRRLQQSRQLRRNLNTTRGNG